VIIKKLQIPVDELENEPIKEKDAFAQTNEQGVKREK
jgi:hypothetical protein